MVQFGAIASVKVFKKDGTQITQEKEIPLPALEYLEKNNVDGLEELQPNEKRKSAAVCTSPLSVDYPNNGFVYVSNNHYQRQLDYGDRHKQRTKTMYETDRTGTISVFLNEDGDSVERTSYQPTVTTGSGDDCLNDKV